MLASIPGRSQLRKTLVRGAGIEAIYVQPSINIRAASKLCPQNAREIPPFYVSKFPQYIVYYATVAEKGHPPPPTATMNRGRICFVNRLHLILNLYSRKSPFSR